jgi:outer membrane protein assembly factor BamB/tetratricopeptide (TPR) repeat protein
MSFKGDLSTIGLAEVFQMISMSQKEGTLIVQDSESRKSIYFGSTGVKLVSTGKRKGLRLGDILLRSGRISEAQLEEALENSKIQRKLLGEILVEAGVVSDPEIQQLVREQIEEEIYDLFLWKKANFEFIEGPASEGLRDVDAPVTRLTFDVNGLLLEAVRRADEWALINQKLPSLDSIFVFSGEEERREEEQSAPDSVRRVARLLDGQTSVAEIVESLGVSRFEACKAVSELFDRGRIRLLSVPELMDVAVRKMSEGPRDRALRLYRAAAAQAPGDPKVLIGVARVVEAEGVTKEAAGYYARAGKAFLEQGEFDRALDYTQQACKLSPEDPDLRLALFEVHAAAGNLEEGKSLAREIVAAALMLPDYPRARMLCDRILNADPSEIDFRVFRAKVFHRTGQKRELEEDLNWIRKNMPADERKASEIQRDLKEVLVRQPTSVKKSPTTIREPAPAGTGKGAVKAVAALALAAILGAGGFAGYRELSARRELDGLLAKARERLDSRDFEAARAPVAGFLAAKWSLFQGGRAQAFLAEVDAAKADWELKQQELETRVKKAADDRMNVLKAQVEEERTRNPALALQRAREYREAALAAKDAVRVKEAEDLAAALDRFLAEAYQLKADADQLEKAGKFREAALAIDRLLADYQNTDPARGALYPLAITSRPPGVAVTSVRTGLVLGETSESGVLMLRMKPGEAVRLLFEKPGYGSLERDVRDKTAGRMHADLTEKRSAWTFPVGASIDAEPAVLGPTLFVASANRLYALSLPERGRLEWVEALDGTLQGAPVPGRDRVYVATNSGTLFAIDPRSSDPEKRVVWRLAAGDRLTAAPALSPDGGTVYAVTGDRQVQAVDAATGRLRWKRELPAEARVAPVASTGRVVVACEDGTMLALKGTEAAEEAWRWKSDGAFGPMALAGGTIYAGSADQHLYAVGEATGQRMWRRLMPSLVAGRPGRAGGSVYAALRDGKVHFLNAETGVSQGSYEAGAPTLGGVVVSGSTVFFGSDDQSLYAFDASLQSLSWRFRGKGRIRLPAVVNGRQLYFGAEDSLYAIDLD